MFGLFKKRPTPPPAVSPVVDLAALTCGDLRIGQLVSLRSAYGSYFVADTDEPGVGFYRNEASGIELTTRDDVVDSIFISLDSFSGSFTSGGEPMDLKTKSTESDVAALLGEPWWKDVDEDLEVIYFYELKDGLEIQMEFQPLCGLSCITILREGILSNAEQRKAYGVTKPWPPANTN